MRLAARLDRSYRLARLRAALGGLRTGELWPVVWCAIGPAAAAAFRGLLSALTVVCAFAPAERVVWRFVPLPVFAFLLLLHAARRCGTKDPDVESFDALRMPSRAALVLGRILRHGVFLAVAGGALALFTLVQLGMMPEFAAAAGFRNVVSPPDRTGGEACARILALAMFVAPAAFAVRAAASVVAERAAGHDDAIRLPAVVAGFAAAIVPVAILWIAAGAFPLGGAAILCFFLWVDVFERIDPRRPWMSAARTGGDVLWPVASATLLFGSEPVLDVLGAGGRLAVAAYSLVWPVASFPGWIAAIREGAPRTDAKTPRHDGALRGGPPNARTYGPIPEVPPALPGRGFFCAQRERRAIDDMIGEREDSAAPPLATGRLRRALGLVAPWLVRTGPRAATGRSRAGGAIYRLAVYGSGPLFGALAASESADARTSATGPLLYAVCAAVLARRAADTDPSPRIHLLGADWREQVRANLSCFLSTAAPPVLLAAGLVAAARGFTTPALTGVAAVASLLLLRAGWPGLAGVSAGRVTWGCLAILAAVAAAPFVSVPADAAPGVIAALAVAGLAGVARLLLTSEAALAARMRD